MSPNRKVIDLLLLPLILILVCFVISCGGVYGEELQVMSVHQILPKYGLPSGLFPNSVQSFEMDADNFEMKLRSSCKVDFFDYPLLYDSSIKGTLRYGSIVRLEGIQMQRFNMWFEIDRIRVDLPPTNNIYFHIMFMLFEISLDVDQFTNVRSCSRYIGYRLPAGSAAKTSSV